MKVPSFSNGRAFTLSHITTIECKQKHLPHTTTVYTSNTHINDLRSENLSNEKQVADLARGYQPKNNVSVFILLSLEIVVRKTI